MEETLFSLLQLLVSLAPLLILQRLLHRDAQAVFLLLTRRLDLAVALFSLMFFPGVLLHETSHYLMARLLQVRTGRFSLWPRALPNGRLQLGFVETASADWVRDALIGIAPLLLGGAFVAYAGLSRIGLVLLWAPLVNEGLRAALDVLPVLYAQPDFWLWFYLTFAVSSTMLPSPSDRRSWLPLILMIALLLALSLLAGAGPWMLLNLAPYLNRVFQAVAVVFAISAFIHAILWPLFWFMRRFLVRLTGLDVVRAE